MFGRGRFNRLRYNPPEISDDYALHEMISASVEAAPTFGEDILFSDRAEAAFHGRGRGLSFAVAVYAHGAEAVQSSINAGIIHYHQGRLSAQFSAQNSGTLNCHVSGMIAAALMHRSREQGNITVEETMRAALKDNAELGANYTLTESEAVEIMSATVGTARTETEYATISITIPANGRLEIDSENYTVTLNGENILFAYSGAWLELDRSVKFVEVALPTSPGAWAVGIEYRERFL